MIEYHKLRRNAEILIIFEFSSRNFIVLAPVEIRVSNLNFKTWKYPNHGIRVPKTPDLGIEKVAAHFIEKTRFWETRLPNKVGMSNSVTSKG